MIKKIIYLGYYFKEINRSKLRKNINYVTRDYQITKFNLWKDIILSSIKYNISILDYFYFRFFEIDKYKRKTYAGTGFMYEYQLLMNPKNERDILENKLIFLEKYSKFIKHKHCSKKNFLNSSLLSNELINSQSKKLVIKSSDGQCGEGIVIIDINKVSKEEIVDVLLNTENDLIEEFIVQHDELMRLSPSGLNTIRIFTQLDKNDEIDILGTRLRITVNSYVDNLAAGNLAAPINVKTGIVEGSAVYSDITKNDEYKHPITGVEIIGFQIPYWDESLKLVKEAAVLYKQNRSIGWDVAITNNGPELLEGNHNWCKLLWQLPVKKGLKKKLEKYL